jgi:excisionase family DNA binding protein
MTATDLVRELDSLSARLQARGEGDAAATVSQAADALRQREADTGAPNDVLTTSEAAALLGVRSVNTVKRWASEGRLKGYRLGSRVLVSRQSVEQMLRDSALERQQAYERELAAALAPFEGSPEEAVALTGTAHRRAPSARASVVARTAGLFKSSQPALSPSQEREAAELAWAEAALERMGE